MANTITLPVTYESPGENAPELWNGTQEHWRPVALRCAPKIYASHVAARHNCALMELPEMHWDRNVQEIWVESRKAYDIICNITRPPQRQPLIRILRRQRSSGIQPFRREFDVVVCVHSRNSEITLGTEIADRLEGVIAVGERHWHLAQSGKAAIFPLDWSDSEYWLALMTWLDIPVVTSDAGAAEEYLCHCGSVGRWHVAHKPRAELYIEAIKDLRGDPNAWPQSDFLDELPWATPWRTH